MMVFRDLKPFFVHFLDLFLTLVFIFEQRANDQICYKPGETRAAEFLNNIYRLHRTERFRETKNRVNDRCDRRRNKR